MCGCSYWITNREGTQPGYADKEKAPWSEGRIGAKPASVEDSVWLHRKNTNQREDGSVQNCTLPTSDFYGVRMTDSEDHIRELCGLALTAKSDEEVQAILSELRSAL